MIPVSVGETLYIFFSLVPFIPWLLNYSSLYFNGNFNVAEISYASFLEFDSYNRGER